MQLSKCNPNPLLFMSCLSFITLDNLDSVFTTIVDSRATNGFVHSSAIQHLNATTEDVLAMRITLNDGLYIDCFISIPLYLKLCRNYTKVALECLKLYM